MKRTLAGLAFTILMTLESHATAFAYPHDVYCDDAFASADYAGVISACGEVEDEARQAIQRETKDEGIALDGVAVAFAQLRIGWAHAERDETDDARRYFEYSRRTLNAVSTRKQYLPSRLRQIIKSGYDLLGQYEQKYLR